MQQINLYLDEFKVQEPRFSAAIIVIINSYIVAIGLIFALIFWLFNQWQLNNQNMLKEYARDQQIQLNKAMQEHPEPKIDQSIIEEITALEVKQRKNRNILKYLNKRENQQEDIRFSHYLSALSTLDQRDTWLTKIELEGTHLGIELIGYALHSNAIPEYISKLSQLKEFNGITFQNIDLKREGEYLRFIIGSREKQDLNAISSEKKQANPAVLQIKDLIQNSGVIQ